MNFHDYIFKTLRWMPGLRPGPIMAVLHGLARVFNDVVKDMYWLRDQMNPATCELQFLGPLAESRGITRHRLETDNDQFRQRVVKAFAWQLLGGKSQGMPKLLQHFGYEVDEPVNVRGEDEARWAEFRIDVNEPAIIKEDDYHLQLWAINEAKPGRSKLAAIRYNATLENNNYMGGIVTTGDVEDIPLHIDISVAETPNYIAASIHEADIITIDLHNPDVSVEPTDFYVAGLVQVFDIISIGDSNG